MMHIFSLGLMAANRRNLAHRLRHRFPKSINGSLSNLLNNPSSREISQSVSYIHPKSPFNGASFNGILDVILDGVELFLYNNHLYILPAGAADAAYHWLRQSRTETHHHANGLYDHGDYNVYHLTNDLSLKPILAGTCLAESVRFLQKSDTTYLFNWLVNLGLNGIYIAPSLSESHLAQWAKVSDAVNLSLRILLPVADELPHYHYPLQWQLKRCGDWCSALLMIIILSPLFLITAGLVKLTSKGPVLFEQWRVGKQGKLFKILKFRTMIVEAEALHHQVMAGQNGLHKCQKDPRVTLIGGFLRKYSIDELPQLFNVLRGEMSLVGPRPWALYDALRIDGAGKRRLNALPGLTGAWQVSKRSTLLDLNAVTQYDLQYLGNWSLWEDLQILFLTVPKVLSGFGAF